MVEVVAREVLTVEEFAVDIRLLYERAYQREPERTHATLVARGYWHAAAQMKIDYEVGRLAEQTVSSWDLAKQKVHETIAAHGMLAPPPALAALPLLLERVHAIVLRAGLDLAAPQLDQNPDDSIDLVWFSRRAQSAVGLESLISPRIASIPKTASSSST